MWSANLKLIQQQNKSPCQLTELLVSMECMCSNFHRLMDSDAKKVMRWGQFARQACLGVRLSCAMFLV